MHAMDATDVEHGFGAKLVCISEINEDSEDDDAFIESNFADDSATVATAESSDTKTKKSPLVGMARNRKSFTRRTSFVRMKSIPSLRKRGSSSESVHSSSEDTSHDDFLLMGKKKTGVEAADKWWKFVFVFSFISMTACVMTLWLEYPYGARMSTEEVATMPWSNGCVGLDSCICPR
ncbi:hypothetical protein THAOC_01320, partial [Thalassiosira oceanica]